MNYTNIEQSKRLLELGLSPDTADSFWMNAKLKHVESSKIPFFFDDNYHRPIWDFDLPCWSVGRLFELIPDESSLNKSDKVYWCGYQFYQTKDYDTPIDALIELMIYLLDNKLINNQ